MKKLFIIGLLSIGNSIGAYTQKITNATEGKIKFTIDRVLFPNITVDIDQGQTKEIGTGLSDMRRYTAEGISGPIKGLKAEYSSDQRRKRTWYQANAIINQETLDKNHALKEKKSLQDQLNTINEKIKNIEEQKIHPIDFKTLNTLNQEYEQLKKEAQIIQEKINQYNIQLNEFESMINHLKFIANILQRSKNDAELARINKQIEDIESTGKAIKQISIKIVK